MSEKFRECSKFLLLCNVLSSILILSITNLLQYFLLKPLESFCLIWYTVNYQPPPFFFVHHIMYVCHMLHPPCLDLPGIWQLRHWPLWMGVVLFTSGDGLLVKGLGEDPKNALDNSSVPSTAFKTCWWFVGRRPCALSLNPCQKQWAARGSLTEVAPQGQGPWHRCCSCRFGCCYYNATDSRGRGWQRRPSD